MALSYTAPCPAGHPDARWVDRGDGARVKPENFTIRCRVCEPPASVVLSNPTPHRLPWRAA